MDENEIEDAMNEAVDEGLMEVIVVKGEKRYKLTEKGKLKTQVKLMLKPESFLFLMFTGANQEPNQNMTLGDLYNKMKMVDKNLENIPKVLRESKEWVELKKMKLPDFANLYRESQDD